MPETRLKILFVGPLPNPVTGQSLACQILFDQLVKEHEVDLIDLNKGGFAQGVSSFGRVFAVFGIVWKIWRRKHDKDLIYFTISESIAGNAKDLLIYFCCLPQLKRMVIHLHGGAGMREIMHGRHTFLRFLNSFIFRRLGAVVVLGARHVDLFTGIVAPKRIRLVPNFAQDYIFSNLEAIHGKFHQTRPLKILFLSNLISGKGYLELVAAVRALDKTRAGELEVDFAGGFENDGYHEQFSAQISNMPMICYHGKVSGEAKRSLLARAHILCLPTYYPYEGQPISILEAYAAGCAVITTDHSGIFDIFTPNINGYAVHKRSVESLTSAILKSLANTDTLRAMAIENFTQAQSKYRTVQHTRNLIAVLKSTVSDLS